MLTDDGVTTVHRFWRWMQWFRATYSAYTIQSQAETVTLAYQRNEKREDENEAKSKPNRIRCHGIVLKQTLSSFDTLTVNLWQRHSYKHTWNACFFFPKKKHIQIFSLIDFSQDHRQYRIMVKISVILRKSKWNGLYVYSYACMLLKWKWNEMIRESERNSDKHTISLHSHRMNEYAWPTNAHANW